MGGSMATSFKPTDGPGGSMGSSCQPATCNCDTTTQLIDYYMVGNCQMCKCKDIMGSMSTSFMPTDSPGGSMGSSCQPASCNCDTTTQSIDYYMVGNCEM